MSEEPDEATGTDGGDHEGSESGDLGQQFGELADGVLEFGPLNAGTEQVLGGLLSDGPNNQVFDAGNYIEQQTAAAGCAPGCGSTFVYIVLAAGLGALMLLSAGKLLLGALGSAGSEPTGPGTVTSAVAEQMEASPPETDEAGWIPRNGTWEIENLPFLPDCGPGSLGSGFQEGTIEVIDDGAFIIASGSQPGTASIELSLVDADPGRLVYLGVESITGLEMTMTFSSPTEMEATVSNGGDICLERPATGLWDREIGAPDPDVEESMSLPEWLPAGFPVSGGGQVGVIETETTKSVTILVEDRPPTDVLFEVVSWAVDQGYAVLERGMSTYKLGIDESRLMYVEVVDIGNFNTQLTVTIEDL